MWWDGSCELEEHFPLIFDENLIRQPEELACNKCKVMGPGSSKSISHGFQWRSNKETSGIGLWSSRRISYRLLVKVYLMGYALCRRPPIIAHCFRIVDSWHCCKRIFVFLNEICKNKRKQKQETNQKQKTTKTKCAYVFQSSSKKWTFPASQIWKIGRTPIHDPVRKLFSLAICWLYKFVSFGFTRALEVVRCFLDIFPQPFLTMM